MIKSEGNNNSSWYDFFRHDVSLAFKFANTFLGKSEVNIVSRIYEVFYKLDWNFTNSHFWLIWIFDVQHVLNCFFCPSRCKRYVKLHVVWLTKFISFFWHVDKRWHMLEKIIKLWQKQIFFLRLIRSFLT